MTTLREDDFIKLDEAITIVLKAARQHAHNLDKNFEDWEAGNIRDSANTVEDFFVNNVFNED